MVGWEGNDDDKTAIQNDDGREGIDGVFKNLG